MSLKMMNRDAEVSVAEAKLHNRSDPKRKGSPKIRLSRQ
jgi:hypothetical protein